MPFPSRPASDTPFGGCLCTQRSLQHYKRASQAHGYIQNPDRWRTARMCDSYGHRHSSQACPRSLHLLGRPRIRLWQRSTSSPQGRRASHCCIRRTRRSKGTPAWRGPYRCKHWHRRWRLLRRCGMRPPLARLRLARVHRPTHPWRHPQYPHQSIHQPDGSREPRSKRSDTRKCFPTTDFACFPRSPFVSTRPRLQSCSALRSGPKSSCLRTRGDELTRRVDHAEFVFLRVPIHKIGGRFRNPKLRRRPPLRPTHDLRCHGRHATTPPLPVNGNLSGRRGGRRCASLSTRTPWCCTTSRALRLPGPHSPFRA